MKCQVCGKESGKYILCTECNEKKKQGEIIKCEKCHKWHYASQPCPIANNSAAFLYSAKNSILTNTEIKFYNAIKQVLPNDYLIFPQTNLATFIERNDQSKYRNELFRNTDFLITNANYQPLIAIEINDQSHLTPERKSRDEKVKFICEEAGIPLIKLWTNYGVNIEYIQKKISETLSTLPVERIHHFSESTQQKAEINLKTKKGCYVATCIYGSYDCPEVWTLRRFRDQVLDKSFIGQKFIYLYYKISPTLVKHLGNTSWFQFIGRRTLNILVKKLNRKGFLSTPYND